MNSIQQTKIIQPNTIVHIINGNWTHYFLEDSYTHELLGLINKPNEFNIHPIPKNITYQELHPNCELEIQEYPMENWSIWKSLDPSFKQTRIFYPNKWYTDGTNVYEQKSNHAIIITVLNPEHLQNVTISLFNLFTQQMERINVTTLYPEKSKEMANLLYDCSVEKNHLAKQLFSQIALRIDPVLQSLHKHGQLLKACSSAEVLHQLMDEQLQSGAIEIPGYFFYPGSDHTYYYVTKINQTTYLFQKWLYNSYYESKEQLKTQSITDVQLQQFIQLVNTAYFEPKDCLPTLYGALECLMLSDYVFDPSKEFPSKFHMSYGTKTEHRYHLQN